MRKLILIVLLSSLFLSANCQKDKQLHFATGIDHISTGVADPFPVSAANLASVDQITLHITGIADRILYMWHPTSPNGKLVLFIEGHHSGITNPAAYELGNISTMVRKIIEAGYTVCYVILPPGTDGTDGMIHGTGASAPYIGVTALSYFLDSSVRILNEYEDDFTDFYMVGLSGGGWTTTFMAALDERITKSAPVDGSLPLQARILCLGATDFEQMLIGLNDIVDYPDLYLMATTSNRKQTQYLGTYDLYFNIAMYKHSPYIPAIRAITSNFNLVWDNNTSGHEYTTGQMVDIVGFFNS